MMKSDITVDRIGLSTKMRDTMLGLQAYTRLCRQSVFIRFSFKEKRIFRHMQENRIFS